MSTTQPPPLQLFPISVEYSEKDSGFVAITPDLPGCIAFGATAAAALESGTEGQLAWLEAAKRTGLQIPQPRNVPVTSRQPAGGVPIDHVWPLHLSRSNAERFSRELQQMAFLRFGLDTLYAQALGLEQSLLRDRVPLAPLDPRGPDLGGLLSPQHQQLATCLFHWYSTSACMLAQMTGWIALQCGLLTINPLEYTGNVWPAIKGYRDKVGAHFAGTMKSGKDNSADRTASMYYSIGLHNGRLAAHPFHVVSIESAHSGTAVEDSLTIGSFKLTEVHLAVRARYWPSPMVIGGEDIGINLNPAAIGFGIASTTFGQTFFSREPTTMIEQIMARRQAPGENEQSGDGSASSSPAGV